MKFYNQRDSFRLLSRLLRQPKYNNKLINIFYVCPVEGERAPLYQTPKKEEAEKKEEVKTPAPKRPPRKDSTPKARSASAASMKVRERDIRFGFAL